MLIYFGRHDFIDLFLVKRITVIGPTRHSNVISKAKARDFWYESGVAHESCHICLYCNNDSPAHGDWLNDLCGQNVSTYFFDADYWGEGTLRTWLTRHSIVNHYVLEDQMSWLAKQSNLYRGHGNSKFRYCLTNLLWDASTKGTSV